MTVALSNWPFTPEQVRKAVGLKDTEGDVEDLNLWATFVTELVDTRTGRDLDPEAHVITGADGVTKSVPVAFVMAARASARLLWRQEMNVSGRSAAAPPGAPDVPAGADMPAKAKAWLANYGRPLVA